MEEAQEAGRLDSGTAWTDEDELALGRLAGEGGPSHDSDVPKPPTDVISGEVEIQLVDQPQSDPGPSSI